jgi:hypothetical protein
MAVTVVALEPGDEVAVAAECPVLVDQLDPRGDGLSVLLLDGGEVGGLRALVITVVAASPGPVVQLNRAVAASFVEGPAAGLHEVDAITGLHAYHPLHSVRADLLTRLRRTVVEGG